MQSPELHQPVAARFQPNAKHFYRGIQVDLLDADFDAMDGTELDFIRTENEEH
jgi:hypothetical protein